MDQQQIIICQKHKKKQKKVSQIPSNYYICLNRYCPNAYTILCSACKAEHRDHQIKILTIEDIAFLIERLLKLPFRQVGTFINQSVQILKKVKYVYQFTTKVTQILNSLQVQLLQYVTMTQKIVSQYAHCKSSTQELSQCLQQLDSPSLFQQFRSKVIKKLAKIDYNVQKDILEYGNLEIKEMEDSRKKMLGYARRKVEEVKEYSMKIIEVILTNDQSDQEDEDIAAKKKNYQNLKGQIKFLKKLKVNEEPLQELSQSKSKSKIQKIPQMEQKIIQTTPSVVSTTSTLINTDNKWILQFQKNQKELQKTIKTLQSKFQSAKFQYQKSELDYKQKLLVMQRDYQAVKKQRQTLKREKQRIQKQYEQKMELFTHYEQRLRDNMNKRATRYQERDQAVKELMNLVENQHKVGVLGGSLEKENRGSLPGKG